MGSSVFLGVSHAPSQSSGAQRSLKFLGLLHARTETTTKFCTVIKPKMLTRDLFAEADLLVRFSRHELCFSWDSDLLTIWGNMNWSHVGTVVRCYCCCRCRGRLELVYWQGQAPVDLGYQEPAMLILVLVLVLKDSLRTKFKSLSLSLSCPGPCRLGPCPCPCRSSPWQVLLLNLACNTHSIVLIVIYLFTVVDFTVICCELSLCVHCCCSIAIVGLAATCSK